MGKIWLCLAVSWNTKTPRRIGVFSPTNEGTKCRRRTWYGQSIAKQFFLSNSSVDNPSTAGRENRTLVSRNTKSDDGPAYRLTEIISCTDSNYVILFPMLYDLAIIGGGPAGVAAGVYAARKKLKTVFIAKDFGGQSSVSTGIENWIGTVRLDGAELAKNLEAHLRAYAADVVVVRDGEWVKLVEKNGANFRITTDKNAYDARAVFIATGSARRKLPAKGADRLEHKGLTYCASCDGPVFAGKKVAVVGGGNAAFESAAQLLAYCPQVYLIHRSDSFKADEVITERVLANLNVIVIKNAEVMEVKGDQFVRALVYKDKITGTEKEIAVEGVFVEIGSTPATDFVKDIVARTEYGQIITDPKNQRASAAGIWAAGDCTDGLYHQNNIAAGDAVKALEDIYLYLHGK